MGALLAVMAYIILVALLFIFLTHSSGLRQRDDAERAGVPDAWTLLGKWVLGKASQRGPFWVGSCRLTKRSLRTDC